MNKTMMILASAVVASATALAPAAEAKGGGRSGGGGGHGMKFSGGPGKHHHHHHFRRGAIVTPSHSAEVSSTKRSKPAVGPADRAPIIRYSDGRGRVYDVGSKAWGDGNNRCWTGPLAWTYKGGGWLYGGARWYEADGTWRTDAAEAPRVVDCETIPAFASLKPTTELEVARSGPDSGPPKAPPAVAAPRPAREGSPAASAATKPGDCKKYFPSIGGMVSVPCEG